MNRRLNKAVLNREIEQSKDVHFTSKLDKVFNKMVAKPKEKEKRTEW